MLKMLSMMQCHFMLLCNMHTDILTLISLICLAQSEEMIADADFYAV
jgi:hypothetical protein